LQTKVVEKIKTPTLCSIIFFPENGAVYEIRWEIFLEEDRPQVTTEYDAYALHAV